MDSAQAVIFVDSHFHENGKHPDSPTADQAGVLVRRASHLHGTVPELDGVDFLSTFSGGPGEIRENSGDGLRIGGDGQTGAIHAVVRGQRIHANDGIGLRIAQFDAAELRTTTAVLSNDIFRNGAGGIRFSTSFQRALGPRENAAAGNDVHHNAIAGTGCVPPGAVQSASQVVFDGPVAVEPAHLAACSQAQVDTASECHALANPDGPDSEGVVTSCIWTGFSCAPAWNFGGQEGASCGPDRNRVFSYVNDPLLPDVTQKGVVALNGAIVRARHDVWGVGGAASGAWVDSGTGSAINLEQACGTISTCTGSSAGGL